MQDVLVRRCTVRVVRRSGWSWGPEPRRLVRRITDAVPSLVAAKLAELFKDAPHAMEVRDAIRVRVRLRLDEIKSLGSSMQTIAGGPTGWQARLDRELESAIPAATRVSESSLRDEWSDVTPTSTPAAANSEFEQFVEILGVSGHASRLQSRMAGPRRVVERHRRQDEPSPATALLSACLARPTILRAAGYGASDFPGGLGMPDIALRRFFSPRTTAMRAASAEGLPRAIAISS